MRIFGPKRPSRDQIVEALRSVPDPDVGVDVVEAGRIESVALDGAAATIAIAIDPNRADAYAPVRAAVEQAARGVAGVESATAILTAHSEAPSAPAEASRPPAPDLGGAARRAPPSPTPIKGVARVIAVGSGKGGVGKSTVSANLAIALAAEGWRVGLLDADIYGPSQPKMMGLEGAPPPTSLPLQPLEAYGVKVMSIGFLVPPEEAVVWRGPMLMKALTQLLHECDWGVLDALIVDLPPGTGDVQLSLAQRAMITGAVIVSTPQDVALIDARKALRMFEKLGAPILGLVENMSTYICPKCGHEAHLFGHGGTKAEAEKIGAPFLGEIPLDLYTRLSGDAGVPIAASDAPQAASFASIAQRLVDAIAAGRATASPGSVEDP